MGTGRVCIEVRLKNVGILSVAAGHVAIFSLENYRNGLLCIGNTFTIRSSVM